MNVEKEHGPETVCYMNGPCGPEPFLECLCGWNTTASTWEDVGQDFDIHLALAKLREGDPREPVVEAAEATNPEGAER